MYHDRTCTVVIPAKNESQNLPRLLDLVPDFLDEVIVVVGQSSDDTKNVAQFHPKVSKVIEQTTRGKGSGLSLGFSHANGDLVVMLDSDGSMNPDEISALFEELVRGADVAKGSRIIDGGHSDDLTWFRKLGNSILTKFANKVFGQNWTDLAYGYAAFTRQSLLQLEVGNFDQKIPTNLWLSRRMSYGQGFEIETLLFCRSARRGLKVVEVPSVEHPRWHGHSNLLAVRDGMRALGALVVERIRSKRQPN